MRTLNHDQKVNLSTEAEKLPSRFGIQGPMASISNQKWRIEVATFRHASVCDRSGGSQSVSVVSPLQFNIQLEGQT